MANKQPQTVTINDKEYNVDDLTEQQLLLVNHVADLARKINSTQFQLDQLQVGRSAFMDLLNDAMNETDAEVEHAA